VDALVVVRRGERLPQGNLKSGVLDLEQDGRPVGSRRNERVVQASRPVEASSTANGLRSHSKFCRSGSAKLEYLSAEIASGSGPSGITRRAPEPSVSDQAVSPRGFRPGARAEVADEGLLPMTPRA